MAAFPVRAASPAILPVLWHAPATGVECPLHRGREGESPMPGAGSAALFARMLGSSPRRPSMPPHTETAGHRTWLATSRKDRMVRPSYNGVADRTGEARR